MEGSGDSKGTHRSQVDTEEEKVNSSPGIFRSKSEEVFIFMQEDHSNPCLTKGPSCITNRTHEKETIFWLSFSIGFFYLEP